MNTAILPDEIELASSKPSSRRGRWGRVATRVLVMGAVVLVAEGLTRRASSPFFPPPFKVWAWARESWFDGPAWRLWIGRDLVDTVKPSLQRLGTAYVLAVTGSIVIGSLICASMAVRSFTYPLVHFLRSIPSAAAVPMWIVVFGIGDTAKVWVITLAVGLTLVVSVVDGITAVDKALLDTARIYHIGPWTRQWAILLPGALPRIFAGLRVTTAIALVAMILAELNGASDGIGFFIIYAQRNFQIRQMWAAIILVGIIGTLMNVLLTLVERRALTWHQSQRRT